MDAADRKAAVVITRRYRVSADLARDYTGKTWQVSTPPRQPFGSGWIVEFLGGDEPAIGIFEDPLVAQDVAIAGNEALVEWAKSRGLQPRSQRHEHTARHSPRPGSPRARKER